MAGIEVSNISKSYAAARVLDAVSAGFAEGRLTSLLGPSGSGKTTLLRIIAGFVAADSGRVHIGGEDVTDVAVWRRRIGMVFQSYALFPHMSVADNVGYGLRRRGIRGAEAAAEITRALAMVRLTGMEQRRPAQLSGGQQQRVALARAIVIRPRVLLLDEPLSALDRRLRQDMQVELRRIQREVGLTTLFVTHDQEEALTLSDHVAILDRGRIVQMGEPGAIYERPRTRFAASFLGDANFLRGRVVVGGIDVAGHTIRTEDALPTLGSEATLAVRPEKLAVLLAPSQNGGENTLKATVTSVIYAGAASTYLASTADGAVLRIFRQNRDAPPLAPGDAVILAWSAAHTVLVED